MARAAYLAPGVYVEGYLRLNNRLPGSERIRWDFLGLCRMRFNTLCRTTNTIQY